MATIEERLAELEARAVHIEEQIGALETNVKELKEKIGSTAATPS